MNAAIFGFVGACIAIGVFVAGVFFGGKLRDNAARRRDVRVEQAMTEQQRERLKKEQEAFRQLMSYSIEDAYKDTPDDGMKAVQDE